MRTTLICLITIAMAPTAALAEDQSELTDESSSVAEQPPEDSSPPVRPPEKAAPDQARGSAAGDCPSCPAVAPCEYEDCGARDVCHGGGPSLQDIDYAYSIEVYASIDEQVRHVVTPINYACRPNWRGVEFEFVGLPEGATVVVSAANATAEIRWRPGRDDIGEHQATARVRARGYDWSEAPVTIMVTEEWETFFMPGVQYSLWLPEARDEFGIIQGVSIQYLVAAWIHRNENHGPSHGRFYVDIDLLHSSVSPNLGVAYSFGLTLSFERNPKRRFLIPYFGAEIGGIYQKPEDGKKIHAGQINPLGGLNLWASRNIFVNVTVGYLVPFSHLEQLRGLRVKAGLNFSFW